MTKPYTVVLLYPDYATDDYGADTYTTCVQAADRYAAAPLAQAEALSGNLGMVEDADDFRPILVLEGDVKVLASALDF
jgi:hypothetical protein